MTPEEEERGWEALRARWDDDEAHRAWLAGFTDLEGLARAGGRYREILARAPGDAVAERWRAEVVKRATVAGLASLPRAATGEGLPRGLSRAIALAAGLLVVVAIAWAVRALVGLPRGP